MDAVRAVIANPTVSLRGLVVSAGRARFSAPIAGCVVPVRDLGCVLRASLTISLFGEAAIDAGVGRASRRGEAKRATTQGARRVCAFTQKSPAGMVVKGFVRAGLLPQARGGGRNHRAASLNRAARLRSRASMDRAVDGLVLRGGTGAGQSGCVRGRRRAGLAGCDAGLPLYWLIGYRQRNLGQLRPSGRD